MPAVGAVAEDLDSVMAGLRALRLVAQASELDAQGLTVVPPERAAPNESLDAVVPVQAPAGSLIVWHGHTWHGPFPRTVPGLRISVLFYFCREYVAAQERYGNAVPPELLARNPARFRTLMGLADPYGWDERGPDMARLRASRSGRSQFSEDDGLQLRFGNLQGFANALA